MLLDPAVSKQKIAVSMRLFLLCVGPSQLEDVLISASGFGPKTPRGNRIPSSLPRHILALHFVSLATFHYTANNSAPTNAAFGFRSLQHPAAPMLIKP